MQVGKKDLAEKIIEAEIQKEGKRLEYLMPESSEEDVSEEDREKEIQMLLEKRRMYQEELQRETDAAKQEEYVRRSRRYSVMTKAAVVVLVAGACLVAGSLRSEATRMWWLNSVERIVGTDRGNVVNNDENRIYSDTTVEEAIAEIEDKTGIPMPELQYEPVGLEFDSFDYDEIFCTGCLHYTYNENVIHIYAFSPEDDSSFANIYHGEKVSEEILETGYAEVTIMEIKSEGDQISSAVAEWNYHNHQYQMFGKLPMEELKLILENILY